MIERAKSQFAIQKTSGRIRNFEKITYAGIFG